MFSPYYILWMMNFREIYLKLFLLMGFSSQRPPCWSHAKSQDGDGSVSREEFQRALQSGLGPLRGACENLWKTYGKPAETYGKPMEEWIHERSWEIGVKYQENLLDISGNWICVPPGPSSMVSFHDSTIKNVDLMTTTWDSTRHLGFFSTWDFWIYHDWSASICEYNTQLVAHKT